MTDRPHTAFSLNQVRFVIAVASISASFSGLASNIYFPAIPLMARALSTSVENINLSVTSYMIFQAGAPTLWGPISDTYGRRIALACTMTVFIFACIGLALVHHYYQLVILRCMQSFGSASTIAIGSGILADVTSRQDRGGYMGVFQAGSLLPLAIGPVLGGVFADTLGWRAIFWFLAIYGGVFVCMFYLAAPETLRSIVEDGKTAPPVWLQAPLQQWTSPSGQDTPPAKIDGKLRIDFLGPIKLFRCPEVALVVTFLSVHYAAWQLAITAQSTLFQSRYALGELQIGLTFLSNGFGCMVGSLTTGRLLDRHYRRHLDNRRGVANIEWVRLKTLWVWSPMQCASMLAFGWTIDRHVHIAAPIAFSFTTAWAAMSAQSVVSTYLVDLFAARSATATAALNLGRCLVGACATAVVQPSLNAIGIGWTFTMWTCILLASMGLVAAQVRYGQHWRLARESESAGVS